MLNALLYLITVAIWGSTWLIIRFQLQEGAVVTAVAWRFLLAALMLGLWCLARRTNLRFNRAQWAMILVQGLANFSLNYWFVYLAEARIASGLVAVIFTLLLVFNMIGGRLLFGQRIGLWAALGAAAGLLGVLLVFWPEVTGLDDARQGFGPQALSGLGFALAGTIFSSVGNLMAVQTQRASIGVIPTITLGMGAGGIFMLAVAACTGQPLLPPLTLSFLAGLLYLSLFGSVIAFAAYLTLIGRVGAGPASYNGVVIPIVALILSTVYEGYQWHSAAIAGVCLCLLGNLLVMRGKKAT